MEIEENEELTEVLAHAINGKAYVDEDGFYMLPMILEAEGEVFEDDVPFANEESIADLQKYFSSLKGMTTIRFVL